MYKIKNKSKGEASIFNRDVGCYVTLRPNETLTQKKYPKRLDENYFELTEIEDKIIKKTNKNKEEKK